MKTINVLKILGEFRAAGLGDLPFTVQGDGNITDNGLTESQKAAVLAVVAAHDPNPTLAEARDAKLEVLKAKRDEVAFGESATVEFKGKTFNIAQEDLSRMTLAVSLITAFMALPPEGQAQMPIALPPTITWTCADNTDVDLTIPELMQLYAYAGLNMLAAFATYRALRAQVQSAGSIQAVDGISWP